MGPVGVMLRIGRKLALVDDGSGGGAANLLWLLPLALWRRLRQRT